MEFRNATNVANYYSSVLYDLVVPSRQEGMTFDNFFASTDWKEYTKKREQIEEDFKRSVFITLGIHNNTKAERLYQLALENRNGNSRDFTNIAKDMEHWSELIK